LRRCPRLPALRGLTSDAAAATPRSERTSGLTPERTEAAPARPLRGPGGCRHPGVPAASVAVHGPRDGAGPRALGAHHLLRLVAQGLLPAAQPDPVPARADRVEPDEHPRARERE